MSGMTSLVQAAGVIEHKMETVANNLANVNTVGFKEDQQGAQFSIIQCNSEKKFSA